MDHTFLNSLVTQKNQGAWSSDEIPEEALQVARLTVNHFHNTRITWDDVVSRKQQMEERFRTFKEIVGPFGCPWDMPTNTINASDKLWKKVIKVFQQ